MACKVWEGIELKQVTVADEVVLTATCKTCGLSVFGETQFDAIEQLKDVCSANESQR